MKFFKFWERKSWFWRTQFQCRIKAYLISMHKFLPIILWGRFHGDSLPLWVRVWFDSLLLNWAECDCWPSGVIIELIVLLPLGCGGSGSGCGIGGLWRRRRGTTGVAGHRVVIRFGVISLSRHPNRLGLAVRVASLIGPDTQAVIMETALRGWGWRSPPQPVTMAFFITLLFQCCNMITSNYIELGMQF